MKLLLGSKTIIGILVMLIAVPLLELAQVFDVQAWLLAKLCGIEALVSNCKDLAKSISEIYAMLVGAILLVLRGMSKTPALTGVKAAMGNDDAKEIVADIQAKKAE